MAGGTITMPALINGAQPPSRNMRKDGDESAPSVNPTPSSRASFPSEMDYFTSSFAASGMSDRGHDPSLISSRGVFPVT